MPASIRRKSLQDSHRKARGVPGLKVAFLDNVFFGVLPRQSNNLLADAWFKRHLYRPTVPLIVPTIEGEKCMTMAYLLASPHPHNQPGSGMID